MKYVIKLSKHFENLSYEIKVLKKLNMSKLYREASTDEAVSHAAMGVPRLIDYGLIILKNMHESDLNSCKDINEPDISSHSRVFGYFIIP